MGRLKFPRLRLGFSWYRLLVRPWLFKLPPERAQRLAEQTLAIPPLWHVYAAPRKQITVPLRRPVAGISMTNPIGLAAGFDKQCRYIRSLVDLGFGYLVVGTITPEARPGNPQPRLLRDVRRQSLVNSMGFPSDGLQVIAQRLRTVGSFPVPVIASIAALDPEGFELCHQTLEPLVAGIELNISSPNTQGIRRFQEPEQLRDLLGRLNAHRSKPLFVKLPPYAEQDQQTREQVLALLRECIGAGVTGVTAINTMPVQDERLAMGRGGLSGKAIFADMLRVVRELRHEAGEQLIINACGGVSDGAGAAEALAAGADTVQLYTALVYQGPGVVRQTISELARQVAAQGTLDTQQRMQTGR